MRETAHDTRPTFPHTCTPMLATTAGSEAAAGPSQTAATPHTAPLPRPAAAWEPRSRPSTAEPPIAVRDGELLTPRGDAASAVAAAERGRRRRPRRAQARPLPRRARHRAGSRGQPANTSGGGVSWAERPRCGLGACASGGRSGSRRGGAGAPPRRGRRRAHSSPLVVEVVARHSDPDTRVAHAGSEHMHCERLRCSV
jgi:hypothetical protein